ncbi:MAG TPA: copper-binding protein [Methylomirabilota bacterium]|jgi:Cu/Ag efflux protein CusF
MRLWKVVVLVDLALALGVGGGYLRWGREAARLERELALARAATSVAGAEREVHGEGVVRAVLPDINVIVITHGELPGYMPPMTMGFRVATPKIQETVQVGDAVRFTVRGVPPNMTLTAIATLGR